MTATWVGIDPGGHDTGIVVRSGHRLITWMVITREHDEGIIGVGPDYIAAVIAAVTRARHLGLDTTATRGHFLAVEAINPPTGFSRGQKRPLDPKYVIAAGMVLGGILAVHTPTAIVPPGGNGAGALGTYPPELVTARERAHGLDREAPQKSVARHARSAWDVAGRGPGLAAARIRGGAA